MADSFPIVIIGAGASGLMAAIAASRVRPHSVLLLEKEVRVGRKLLATGNGRCNLLNMRLDKGHYHGSGAHIAQNVLERMTPAWLLDAFAAIGLVCREESEGRVYPFSGQASAVLDSLRLACDRQGVQVLTETPVSQIRMDQDRFHIQIAGQQPILADRVILAGGGKASPSLGSDGSALKLLARLGHTLTDTFPAIVPLRLPSDRIRGLKGIRMQATLTLHVDQSPVHTERGEALLTEYGLSGIAAMQLARETNLALARQQQVTVQIQLMDPQSASALVAFRSNAFREQPMERFFTGVLHKQLGATLLREAGLLAGTPISEASTRPLIALLSDWRLPVLGTQPLAQAQVTAGGALATEFDPQTLASYLIPGLYACGEILDVDGDCGGYNLMWAWASGILAGQSAAASLS